MFENVYRSLSVELVAYIAGRKPQSRLPGVRALSKEFNVNPKTMSKALRLLADRNLIDITPQGTFVAVPHLTDFNCIQVFYASSHTEIQNDFWSYEVQQELSKLLVKQNCSIAISYLDRDQTFSNFITEHGIWPAMKNGIFFIGYIPNDEDIRTLRANNLPAVLLGRKTEGEQIAACGDAVCPGIDLNIKHLLDHGHKKIAIIMAEKDYAFLREHTIKVLKDYGLPTDKSRFINAAPWDYQEGVQATEKLLARNIDFSAVVCFGDQVTLAAIKTFIKHGKRVPDDIAVVGTSLPWMRHTSPILPTGTRPDIPELVKTMVDLMNTQKNGEETNIFIKIPPKLIIGNSCGCK